MSRIVRDPIQDWSEMAGETDLIKQINARVSYDQVGSKVPDNECLEEAQWLVTLDLESGIRNYLILRFSTGEDGESLGFEESCAQTAKRVLELLKGAEHV